MSGVSHGIAEKAVERWEHAGLECCIVLSPVHGKNGYVRLPEPFRSRKLHYADISYEEVEVHGGLTYGMDEGGWVGFDTGHAWDRWLPDSPDEDVPNLHATTSELLGRDTSPPLTQMDVIWTTEKLRAEINRLAEQLRDWCAHHPDFEGEMSAEERDRANLAKLRQLMAEFGSERAAGDRMKPPELPHGLPHGADEPSD